MNPSLSPRLPAHSPRMIAPWAGLIGLVGLMGLLLGAQPLQAATSPEQQRLHLRSLASSCAHCHGTDGRAVEGEALVRLAGLERDYILNQLMAFRSGQRPATIMHQITKGYSQEQLEAVAGYFAAQK